MTVQSTAEFVLIRLVHIVDMYVCMYISDKTRYIFSETEEISNS